MVSVTTLFLSRLLERNAHATVRQLLHHVPHLYPRHLRDRDIINGNNLFAGTEQARLFGGTT